MKYAVDNGMLDLSYVQDTIKMKKRAELLAKHPYTIWEGANGRWKTYLPDEKKGRIQRERSSRTDIENLIIKFYEQQEEKDQIVTFDDMYHRWREVQDELVSDNSIAKYNSDYTRFYQDTDFVKQDITTINEEKVKVFLCRKIKDLSLCQRTSKSLFGYTKNVFTSAKINHVITEHPMENLVPKNFYKYCTNVERPREKTIVSNADMKQLYDRFYEDYRKHPSYIPTYAVEFASLTGMRVGELSALTWECITDSYILIKRSEKYNKITKEFFIDKTKNGKERIFPLTDEIRNLLDRIKKVEIKYGYICEWVFANEEGRIHAPVISTCCKNKCRQAGVTEKGIHAYRRTVNSQMRCGGVSATIAAALLGHSEEVNENYYTFDVSDLAEKAKIVSQVNAQTRLAR